MKPVLCVGTAGMSIWFSDDLGETWARPYSESGLYLEARCWALASHPARPGRALAGTDFGIYEGELAARVWRHVPSPMDGAQVWALAIAPHAPDLVLAGTQPAGIFRSTDGGRSWSAASAAFAESCVFVHRPRITGIVWDPVRPGTAWCGVEIDGVHRSDDGGRTWTKVAGAGLASEDVHGLCVLDAGGGKRRILATTNKGLHESHDDGATFELRPLASPWQYTRTVKPRADGAMLFLTNGNGPPGDDGRLLVSRDGGATWGEGGLPGKLNSTVWDVATHPADPALLLAVTNLGQLFRSTDGGGSWTKLRRELGEVRCAIWTPG